MQDDTALYSAKMMQPGMTAADSEENNLRPQHLEEDVYKRQAMSRPILEQVGTIVPLRAQQVVVPVLAVGLCYKVESDVLRI